MRRRLARFLAVGSLGFLTDSSLTLAVSALTGWPALAARAPAFVAASLVTYLLNRRWTFGLTSPRGFWPGWIAYVGATSLGAGLNYLAFALTVRLLGEDAGAILAGVTFGSLVGLGFNFAASALLFRSGRADRAIRPPARWGGRGR